MAHADGLLKQFADVVVVPVLAGRECEALESLLLLLRLDHFLRNRIVHEIEQVLFGQADEDWCLGHDLSDFSLPLINVLQ